jgi:hypothetical protein
MRRAGRILAIALATLLALVLVALLLAPIFIERTVRAELAKRGVDDVSMDISVPGLTESMVRNLRIGRDGAFTADEIAIDYSVPELVHGRIDRIRLVHPRLLLRISEDGKLSFGSLDPLFEGEDNAGGGLVLPAPIDIVDGSVTAATPAGEITARLDGAVSIEPGAGPLKLNISGPWLSAELAVSISLDGSAPALAGRIMQGRVTHPSISIGSLTGEFTSTLGTEAPSATADFKLKDVSSPWLSVGSGTTEGNLSARYDQHMLTGALRLAGPDSGFEGTLSGDPRQRLHVVLRGNGLAIPEKLTAASLDATLDIDPGARRAQLNEPAKMDARLAPELRAALPDTLRSAVADAPLTLTAEPGLTISRTKAGVTVNGRIGLKQQSGLAASLNGSLERNHASLSGSADLHVDMPKLVLAGVTLQSPSVSAPLEIATAEGETQIRLRASAPLSAKTTTLGTIRVAQLTIPFQPGEQPLFRLGSQGASFALSAGSTKASGQFGQNQEPFALEWKGVTLTGNSGSAPNAALTGGRVTLTRGGWQANGMEMQFKTGDQTSSPPELRFSIAELGQSGARSFLAPVMVKGAVHPTQTPLRFDLDGQGAGGRVHFAIKGSHDLAQNKGSAVLTLDPLHFEQAGLQPRTIAPALGDVLTEATGTLTVGGTISWSSQGVLSDLKVAAQSLAFVSPIGPVLGLDGQIQLTGLSPLATPPGQQIKAAAVQAALPMSDLQLRFGVREGRYLDLENGDLTLANGHVTMAPTTLDAVAERNSLKLKITDIGLAEVFKLIGLDGLTGTGRLSGEVPVAFANKDFAVEAGKLESQEPGVVQYTPATPPPSLEGGGKSVELALAALRNFHYDRLVLELDRKLGGDTLVGLHISGKNPDFYGGYPVEFNLSLSGKLDQILIQSLAGYRIPKTLEDQLKQSPGGSANP